MTRDQPIELKAGGTNAIGRTLGLLADEWTLLVLRQALSGETRYSQFKEALPISNSVLTSRLTRLTEQGLLERHVYQDRPVRAEYLTTRRSRTLSVGMLTLSDWEKRWTPDGIGDEAVARHPACGRDASPVLTCRACRMPATARDVVAEWGPSGSWRRSSPEAVTRRRPELRVGATTSLESRQAMMLFGDRWSAAVICAAFRGVRRFTDFEANLSAPPAVVSHRLKVLGSIGVLTATQDGQRSHRAEHRLTEKGHGLFPVLSAFGDWSERWFAAPEGPALIQTHRPCGERFLPRFRCGHCEGTLPDTDLR